MYQAVVGSSLRVDLQQEWPLLAVVHRDVRLLGVRLVPQDAAALRWPRYTNNMIYNDL